MTNLKSKLDEKIMKLNLTSICSIYSLLCKDYLPNKKKYSNIKGVNIKPPLPGGDVNELLIIMNIDFIKCANLFSRSQNRHANILNKIIKLVTKHQISQLYSLSLKLRKKDLDIIANYLKTLINKKNTASLTGKNNSIKAIEIYRHSFIEEYL